MKSFLYHKIESFVDRAIPYALVVLAGIIIIDIFFKEFAEANHLWLEILDYLIIALFISDLVFKYNRIRKFKPFLKECWLDIIAVFPFVLIFRLFEAFTLFARFPAELREGQSILHTIVEGRKEISEFFGKGSKLIEDARLAGEISRTERILKTVRPLARAPRLVKALPFYEKPTGKHHLHEMEELEEAEMKLKKAGKQVGRDLAKAERTAEKELKGAGRFLEGKLKCHSAKPENQMKKAEKQ